MPDALTLTVRSLTAPTPTSRRLVLDLNGTPFAYEAGQAAAIGMHGHSERRAYSIASAPADTAADDSLEFLIREAPGSGLGRHLGGLAPGARVDLEGPYGDFVLPHPIPDMPLLFIAGGTGVAPLRALARQARAQGHAAPRHLVYAVKSPDDVAYAEEWKDWTRDHGGRCVVTVTRRSALPWAGTTGRPDAGVLQTALAQEPLCFLCGPPEMVENLTHTLSLLNVPADHLRTESWTPGR